MNSQHIRIFNELPSSHNPEVNPYFSKLKESCQEKTLPVLYGPYLRGKKGKWREEFDNKPEDLLLEIGCHKGHTLSRFAQDNKERSFVGLDITYKRVCETAILAQENNLINVRSVLANANEIEHIFDKEELTGVVIFFPDPWLRKKKQKKNRLIKPRFCAILKELLKKNGFIWFKTDSEEYFLEAIEAFKKSGFIESNKSCSFFGKNYESTFEARFKSQSLPTYESFLVPTTHTQKN